MKLASFDSQHVLTYFVDTHDETALVTLLERHYQEVFQFVFDRYYRDEEIAAHITDDAFNWMQHMDYDQTKSFTDWLRVLAGYVTLDYVRIAALNGQTGFAAFNLPERDAAKFLGVTRYEYRQLLKSSREKLKSEYRVSA